MKPERRRTITISLAAAIVVLPVMVLVALHNLDWNRIKPWLNGRAGDALGRPFAIAGDLSLSWSRPAGAGELLEGWRKLLPWPHLLAKDVRIGNPASASALAGTQADATGDMARIGALSFSLNPFALWDRTIQIPVLGFESPTVHLARNADGSNNWTFPASKERTPWRIRIGAVQFSAGTIHLVDAVSRADLTMAIDTLATDPVYGITWTVKGSFNGKPAAGAGKAGGLLSLQSQKAPFPLQAKLKLGDSSVSVAGTLTRPGKLAALDMKLQLSGISMARLGAFTGLVLPETPPFATEGHLLATLGAGSGHWTYRDFHGKVGSSDISGTLDYRILKPRPLLSGTVVSKLLKFSDLAPLIGADSNASKRKRGAPAVQPANKIFPFEPFAPQRWTGIDADIEFNAEKIVRIENLPIEKLSTTLRLQDGILHLAPLDFRIAGGSIRSDIRLDGTGAGRDAITGEISVAARRLQLKRLFPGVELLKKSAGELNGNASLSATGNSVASMLGRSNGEVRTFISKGTVSKLLLERMGLNIGSIVLATLTGDRQVKLHCMATDFAVRSGVMQARSFVIDTEDALMKVSGNINLAREQLNLTVKPGSKGIRVFSLRAPIYVQGSFSQPEVSVDKGVMALKAGGAIALAVLAPVAAVLPLINTGRGDAGDAGDCKRLLAAARVKTTAPTPGKQVPGKSAIPAKAGNSVIAPAG